jgi:hypothetical protein
MQLKHKQKGRLQVINAAFESLEETLNVLTSIQVNRNLEERRESLKKESDKDGTVDS